jgi:hypothetical protein
MVFHAGSITMKEKIVVGRFGEWRAERGKRWAKKAGPRPRIEC